MKVSNTNHKAILQGCFVDETPKGATQKTFTLDKMVDASSAYKKLLDGLDGKSGAFSDKEIEFTLSEIVVLKNLFDEKAKKGFKIAAGEAALEVKALFDSFDKGRDESTDA